MNSYEVPAGVDDSDEEDPFASLSDDCSLTDDSCSEED